MFSFRSFKFGIHNNTMTSSRGLIISLRRPRCSQFRDLTRCHDLPEIDYGLMILFNKLKPRGETTKLSSQYQEKPHHGPYESLTVRPNTAAERFRVFEKPTDAGRPKRNWTATSASHTDQVFTSSSRH